jgi:hypothetical protein
MQNAPITQAFPPAPQLLFVLRAVSQPSACLLLLQSPKPIAQAPLQRPPPQVGEGMWLLEQTRPHPPQLAGLVATLTSHPSTCLLALQSANPVAQAPLQTPPLHDVEGMLLGEQTVPHPPQLAGLVATLTSQPSIACALQLKYPGLHEATVHEPATQLEVAFGRAQTLLHAPQLFGSEDT